jgi:hypothetical protein
LPDNEHSSEVVFLPMTRLTERMVFSFGGLGWRVHGARLAREEHAIVSRCWWAVPTMNPPPQRRPLALRPAAEPAAAAGPAAPAERVPDAPESAVGYAVVADAEFEDANTASNC